MTATATPYISKVPSFSQATKTSEKTPTPPCSQHTAQHLLWTLVSYPTVQQEAAPARTACPVRVLPWKSHCFRADTISERTMIFPIYTQIGLVFLTSKSALKQLSHWQEFCLQDAIFYTDTGINKASTFICTEYQVKQAHSSVLAPFYF